MTKTIDKFVFRYLEHVWDFEFRSLDIICYLGFVIWNLRFIRVNLLSIESVSIFRIAYFYPACRATVSSSFVQNCQRDISHHAGRVMLRDGTEQQKREGFDVEILPGYYHSN